MNKQLLCFIALSAILASGVQAYDDETCKGDITTFKSYLKNPGSMTNLKYKRMVRDCTYLFDGSVSGGYGKFRGFVEEIFGS